MKARALAAASALLLLALLLIDPPYGAAPSEPRAEAALVLSGDVDYLRVQRAAELHARGLVGAIVLVGAGVGGDSALEMLKQAQALGVPREAVLVEVRSKSTGENLHTSAPLLRARGWRRVALVTSASHMGRALRVARATMPEVAWVPVPVPDPGPPTRLFRQRLLEWTKLVWYMLRGWA